MENLKSIHRGPVESCDPKEPTQLENIIKRGNSQAEETSLIIDQLYKRVYRLDSIANRINSVSYNAEVEASMAGEAGASLRKEELPVDGLLLEFKKLAEDRQAQLNNLSRVIASFDTAISYIEKHI